MNGDIDAYHGPMDMLHDATQYLEHMRQTLIEADRFEAFIQSTCENRSQAARQLKTMP